MRGYGWTIDQITLAFQAQGFKLVSLEEPVFGVPERAIFEACGKAKSYESSADHPAIYIMQWRKPASTPRRRSEKASSGGLLLGGARCAIGPDTAETATVSIVGDRIESIAHGPFVRGSLDLSGYLLLPGLINAHDHLEFSLYPNIGRGPYRNAEQWARDIHANHSELIARYRSVPRSTCLWWGGIRNLLCGVTTVCHHNPIYPELTSPDFPVRVVTEFGWAHSAGFEPQLAGKFASHPADLPFVVHAAEGVDDQSVQEIFELDRLHTLDDRTVLVHGLACGPEAVNLINQRGASLIVCPTSNEFLFQRSPSLAMLQSLQNVVLGSDSPLTAAGDLLDEVNFAYAHTGLDAHSIYSMVTTQAAAVLRRKRGEGCLQPGSVADLLVVRDSGLNPADTLVQLTSGQIELVVVGGQVQLAGPAMIERLSPAHRHGLHRFEVDGQARWVRAPIDRLLFMVEEILGGEVSVGKKKVGHAVAS
jgi:cytosine/adenosine deaminase-related metal-dependent hydrolase